MFIKKGGKTMQKEKKYLIDNPKNGELRPENFTANIDTNIDYVCLEVKFMKYSQELTEKIFISFPLYPLCFKASNPLYAILAAVPSYINAKSFPKSSTTFAFPTCAFILN